MRTKFEVEFAVDDLKAFKIEDARVNFILYLIKLEDLG